MATMLIILLIIFSAFLVISHPIGVGMIYLSFYIIKKAIIHKKNKQLTEPRTEDEIINEIIDKVLAIPLNSYSFHETLTLSYKEKKYIKFVAYKTKNTPRIEVHPTFIKIEGHFFINDVRINKLYKQLEVEFEKFKEDRNKLKEKQTTNKKIVELAEISKKFKT